MRRLAPSLVLATSMFAVSAPALADIAPEKEKKEEKSGGCSVADGELGLVAFAGLALAISVTALRRRAR